MEEKTEIQTNEKLRGIKEGLEFLTGLGQCGGLVLLLTITGNAPVPIAIGLLAWSCVYYAIYVSVAKSTREALNSISTDVPGDSKASFWADIFSQASLIQLLLLAVGLVLGFMARH